MVIVKYLTTEKHGQGAESVFLYIYREDIKKSSCQKVLGRFGNNLAQIVFCSSKLDLLRLSKHI